MHPQRGAKKNAHLKKRQNVELLDMYIIHPSFRKLEKVHVPINERVISSFAGRFPRGATIFTSFGKGSDPTPETRIEIEIEIEIE